MNMSERYRQRIENLVHYIGKSFGAGIFSQKVVDYEWQDVDIINAMLNIMFGQKMLTVPGINNVTSDGNPVEFLLPEEHIHIFKGKACGQYFDLLVQYSYFVQGKMGFKYGLGVPEPGYERLGLALTNELRKVEAFRLEGNRNGMVIKK